MLDANHAYNVSSARKILKALEDADIFWFEEPISPEDVDVYRELKILLNIYLAAVENEFTQKLVSVIGLVSGRSIYFNLICARLSDLLNAVRYLLWLRHGI